MVEIKHVEGIKDEAALDNEVKRRISRETWAMIDFKQQGLKIIFDEDIKTKYFETN